MMQVGQSSLFTLQAFKKYTTSAQGEQRKERSSFEENNQTVSHVSISNQAQEQYKKMNELKFIQVDSNGANPLQDSYQKVNKEEAIAHVKRMAEKREKERAERHPFGDDLVTYQLIEGTFTHTIASALEGKVTNPSVYAVKLEEALRGYNIDSENIEARALQREIALQQAQYVAANYFENEEEANAFLSEVEALAENAALFEQGYYVHEGEVFRNYTKPMDNGRVSFNELAKRYMDEEYYERFVNGKGTAAESRAFLLDLQKNEQKYREEIAAEFEENEKLVIEKQNYAKELVSNIDWNNDHFTQVIEDALQGLGYESLAKWNLNMLNLFK